MFLAVSFPTRFSCTSSSKGCAASASPPPAPAQSAFSFDGRYLKLVTRCSAIALIPVWRGVGGGPAGCCTKRASVFNGPNEDGSNNGGAEAASVTAGGSVV